METLAEAGIELVGENRLQDMEAKHELFGDRFQWDFIGNIQSRKLKRILALARLIHSVATDSVLDQLERHGSAQTEILVEVNLAGEANKGGVAPERLGGFHRPLTRARQRSDDDASVHRRPGSITAELRPSRRARRRARARAPVDGHEPGLGGRRR